VTSEILEQRAGVEREIGGRTVCDLLRATAENSGDAPALSNQAAGDGAGWQTLAWGQARQQALALRLKLTRDELCQLRRARRCG